MIACPMCSAPPTFAVRVSVVLGSRSGVPIITGCPHVGEAFPAKPTSEATTKSLTEIRDALSHSLLRKAKHRNDPWRIEEFPASRYAASGESAESLANQWNAWASSKLDEKLSRIHSDDAFRLRCMEVLRAE